MSGSVDTAPASGPIQRQSLHEALVPRVRALIESGDLPPGARVPEKALCDRFGVSRTPMREALKVLASEGWLELTPQRGATVRMLTAADLDEMFPVMAALEALAGQLACERIREADLAEIRALHFEMLSAYERRDRERYFAVNEQIHERILDAAGNATLATMHRSLSGRIRRARFRAAMHEAQWRQAVADHAGLIEALARRDGAALAALLREHLEHKRATVMASMVAA